jgi:flagellar protein FliS
MVPGSKISQYSTTEVTTANRLRLLIMLYDSAIRFIDTAKERLRTGDVAGKGTYIGKALAIVGEFKNTLNFQVGGDLPRELQRLYVFVEERLVRANLKGDPALLDEARRVLDILRGAWVELEQKGVPVEPASERSAAKARDSYFELNA